MVALTVGGSRLDDSSSVRHVAIVATRPEHGVSGPTDQLREVRRAPISASAARFAQVIGRRSDALRRSSDDIPVTRDDRIDERRAERKRDVGSTA
jgi:hypothetical protein